VPGAVEWILDVCHNEPAARVFAAHLAARPSSGRTIAVVGILGDKDIPTIGQVLRPLIDYWIVCTVAEPRGLPAEELARRLALDDGGHELASSAAAGFGAARRRAVPGDRVVVCGGFHVVGSALEWLRIY
jgi:dihydrofolate synthase / folylpolyglutamate synthase